MKRSRTVLAVLPALVMLWFCNTAAANICSTTLSNLPSGTTPKLIEHTFDSGASWTLCAHIDRQAGLTISQLHYGAPNEQKIKVLETAALGQILFKYDEDISARHWLAEFGLGGDNHIQANQSLCPTGDMIPLATNEQLCTEVRDLNNLTSLRKSVSLRRRALSLHAWSGVGAYRIEQAWQFTEDGNINPTVRLGGVLNRFTKNVRFGSDIGLDGALAANASMLFTWKLDFNINNTPTNDIVEEVEFVPFVTDVVRRTISLKRLQTESLHNVNRRRFRGWLVKDENISSGPDFDTRIGYLLDPQSSGYSHTSRTDNWSLFDMALTRRVPCEQLASGNATHQRDCGDDLDDFINGESLVAADPVMWFSLARQFIAKSEDYPAINTRSASFSLIPFDWSSSTPFSDLPE